MARNTRYLRRAVDVLRAPGDGPAGVQRRQQARLTELVGYARSRSAFYAEHYRQLPPGSADLPTLPHVTKPELMSAFDQWATDPAVTRAGVDRFVADPARVGEPFLGSYFVCTSSGTTGQPGVFLHDPFALEVYQLLTYRLDLAWLSGPDWVRAATRGMRWASVVGTGTHFAGQGWVEAQRRSSLWRRHAFRVFSVQQPLTELVSGLNAFDPAILASYPSALDLLADERQAGRLRIRPVLVEGAGESADERRRRKVAAAFGSRIHDAYGASEFLIMACDCNAGWLHVNADWVILEPVDENLAPTPPGAASHTVLMTNLANRVQPMIRYDLGDSITASPDPCPCGNALPAIRVSGREADTMRLLDGQGRPVTIPPLAIGTVCDETPGVRRSQLAQTGPRSVRVRVDVSPGSDPESVWRQVRGRLDDYLRGQALTGIALDYDPSPTTANERSGKFRQVTGWSQGRAA